MAELTLQDIGGMTASARNKINNGDLQTAMTAAGVAFDAADSKSDLLAKIDTFLSTQGSAPATDGAQGGAAPVSEPAVAPVAETPVVQATDTPPADPATGWNAPPAPAATVDLGLLARVVEATNGNSFVYLNTTESAPLVAAGYVETNGAIVDNVGGVATRATVQGIEHMNANPPAAVPPVADAVPPAPVVQGTDAAPAPTTAAEAAAAGAPGAVPGADTSGSSAGAAATVSSAAPGFVIVSVPLPAKRSRGNGGRSSSYPFDKLETGQSFFVAATTAKPNPKKSLASTVSSATRRYATKTDQTRRIKVKGVEKDVPIYNEVRKFEVFDGTGEAYGQPGVKGAIVARTK